MSTLTSRTELNRRTTVQRIYKKRDKDGQEGGIERERKREREREREGGCGDRVEGRVRVASRDLKN